MIAWYCFGAMKPYSVCTCCRGRWDAYNDGSLCSHNDHAFLIADAREMTGCLGFVPLTSSQRLLFGLPSSRHCQTTIKPVVIICQTSTAIQCDLLQPSCFGISACLHPRTDLGDTARKGGSSQIPWTVSKPSHVFCAAFWCSLCFQERWYALSIVCIAQLKRESQDEHTIFCLTCGFLATLYKRMTTNPQSWIHYILRNNSLYQSPS